MISITTTRFGTRVPSSGGLRIQRPFDMIWWNDMIYLAANRSPPGGSSTVHIYTQTIIKQHNRHKQYIEQHSSLIRKSADRAPSLRGIPWHLPYNWGNSTEKPQSGYMSIRIHKICVRSPPEDGYQVPKHVGVILIMNFVLWCVFCRILLSACVVQYTEYTKIHRMSIIKFASFGVPAVAELRIPFVLNTTPRHT